MRGDTIYNGKVRGGFYIMGDQGIVEFEEDCTMGGQWMVLDGTLHIILGDQRVVELEVMLVGGG